MTQKEALEQIKSMTDDLFISAELASKACGIDAKLIRWTAKVTAVNGVAHVFGFRVHVIDSEDEHGEHHRYQVNRQSLIEAIEGGETTCQSST